MRISRIVELSALAAVVIFVVGVTVYSGTIPPVSTIASESMTHSDYWQYGTMNVGDIVFVKKVDNVPGSVITYVVGRERNYSTYGEYGNVVLYRSSDGQTIIHRAMFYLSWSSGRPVVQGYHNQSWMTVTDKYVLIKEVGFSHRNLVVYISSMVNESGFITVGDFNLAFRGVYNSSLNAYEAADQNVGITNAPVNKSSIIGVAFWDIPWFGLIKLNVLKLYGQWPQSNEVAKDTYDLFFAAILVIVVLAAFPYGRVIRRKK
ncbi:S26 family signal peptidase [Thermogymnomonas acidicola]|uniref:S26 family signal peptidase n=1 Tax=Thermogymnomonas acidicola TaxID=399579 RepID=A0AA37BQE6_9ARCH|nr:S26 family signal peptidase [Thermogymnomonas acidicola]GGM70008.1 S26 family signal peptidase [Thermogymnomonas acidicola]